MRWTWTAALVLVACGFDSGGLGPAEDSEGSSSEASASGTASTMTTTAGATMGTSTTTAGSSTTATTTSTTGTTTEPTGDGSTGEPPMLGPWVTPIPVTELQVGTNDVDDPSLTGDQLEIYIAVGAGDETIFVSKRDAIGEPWNTPTPVQELDAPDTGEGTPSVRADGLAILFFRNPPNVDTGLDIFIATRNDRDDPWNTPVPLGDLNSDDDDLAADVAWDAGRVAVCSGRLGEDHDIFEAPLDTASLTAGTPILLDAVSEPGRDCGPRLSANGLTMWFYSDRGGPQGIYNLYETTRPSLDAEFATPTPISDLNTNDSEEDPWVSEDGRTMYFVRNLERQSIWVTARQPM